MMKGYAATVLPVLKRVRLPLRRDLAALLFIVLNELLLGLETHLAHALNGTLRFNEWIPVICGPLAGVMLLVALGFRQRKPRLALGVAVAALVLSMGVGGLGAYFHFVRATRLTAAPGERVSLALLVWGAPLLAPPAFMLVGILGLLALSKSIEGIPGALDTVSLPAWPIEKSRVYFLLTSLGVLIATVSSLFDHLRGGFTNPWLWVPVLCGAFGTITAFALGLISKPTRADLTVYLAAVGLQLVVGPLGLVLHVLHDLGVGGEIIIERFLRGAPILAPMVFANMGLLGLLVLLDPEPQSRTPMPVPEHRA